MLPVKIILVPSMLLLSLLFTNKFSGLLLGIDVLLLELVSRKDLCFLFSSYILCMVVVLLVVSHCHVCAYCFHYDNHIIIREAVNEIR